MKPGRHEPKGGTGAGVFRIGSHVNDLSEFDFYNQFLGGSLFRDQTAKALKHAALLVKKHTLDELRKSMPQAFDRTGGYYAGPRIGHKNGHTWKWFKDRLSEGVRVGRLRGGFNHQEIKVHVMGVRAKGSGTYRLRFYEAGASRTDRGSIPGHGFFKAGMHHVDIWEQVKANLDEYLKKYGWV